MSRRVTDQVLEEVRQRIDIVELIGARVQLKRAGNTYKACCPFHNEKTPSFVVNPVRRSYHCFGCGAHGDIYKFLMQTDGLTFMDAVRALATRAGVSLDTQSDFAAEARNTLLRLHAELTAFYRKCLETRVEAEAARHYLRDRKLDADIASQFSIGYAPVRAPALREWATEAGFTEEQLLEAGVLAPPRDDSRPDDYYDRFHGRLMFPIHDAQGRVVAFSGRILDPSKHPAKYLNSPETPIFQKSRVLYALDKARANIVRNTRREALICEGQIDVIRCHAAGFGTAVAAQGTAFTAEHVALLKRYADSVVLVFDGDSAGIKAALRTGGLFLAADMPARVASLPVGEDPDSLLRDQGVEAFQALLDGAASLTAFQVQVLQAAERDPTSVDAVGRMAREVLDLLVACPSAVLRSYLLQDAAERLHLPVAALTQDLETRLEQARQRTAWEDRTRTVTPRAATVGDAPGGASAAASRHRSRPGAAGSPPFSSAAFALCELLFHHTEAASVMIRVRDWLPLDFVPEGAAREVIGAALEMYQTGADRLSELSHSGSAEVRALIGRLVRGDSRVLHARDSTPLEAAEDLVVRLWLERLRVERQALLPDEGRTEQERPRLTLMIKKLEEPSLDWPKRASLLRQERQRRGLPPAEAAEETSAVTGSAAAFPEAAVGPPGGHAADSAVEEIDPAEFPPNMDLPVEF